MTRRTQFKGNSRSRRRERLKAKALAINHRNAAENGVTQPKSGSFRATHGKEKPTSSWVIFCATVS